MQFVLVGVPTGHEVEVPYRLPEFIKQSHVSNAVRESDKTVAIVKHSIPAVVSIHSEKIIKVKEHQYYNPYDMFEFFGHGFNDPFFKRRQQEPRKPREREYKQQGLGSGVIVNKHGYIITNHHVAGDADNIRITLTDEREFKAKVIGSDKMSDIAVLEIVDPPDDLPILKWGNSDSLEVGETVIAIGSPFGYSNTVTKGIISAKRRSVGINTYENYLQTDASINPGNSGGALINLNGKLIGINTAIASKSGASHGVGFAIPVNMAKDIMDDLISKGHVIRGYLGVYLQNINQSLAKALKLKNRDGALITQIIKGSPADEARLKIQDVVLEVDGKKIKNVNGLRNLVATLDPAKRYSFVIHRDGTQRTFDVKIGKRENDQKAQSSEDTDQTFGFRLKKVTEENYRSYRLEFPRGLMITGVKNGSTAERSGFEAGDVILKMGTKSANSIDAFLEEVDSLDEGDTLLVLIWRKGVQRYLVLTK